MEKNLRFNQSTFPFNLGLAGYTPYHLWGELITWQLQTALMLTLVPRCLPTSYKQPYRAPNHPTRGPGSTNSLPSRLPNKANTAIASPKLEPAVTDWTQQASHLGRWWIFSPCFFCFVFWCLRSWEPKGTTRRPRIPQEIRPYYRTINHWFPLIRPY